MVSDVQASLSMPSAMLPRIAAICFQLADCANLPLIVSKRLCVFPSAFDSIQEDRRFLEIIAHPTP